jgi:XTP/dITP diphosphohydrolase
VEALNGRPGIYSARFAGAKATAQQNINKLLAELKGVPLEQRTARFCCALAYLRYPDDPTPIISQAFWKGIILLEPVGKHGFGYDPIFYIPEIKSTAAQLSPEKKHAISHRNRALQPLLQQLKEFELMINV